MLTKIFKVASCALFALALALPGAHAAESAAPQMTIPAIITGNVSYRERIALQPGSTAIVQLLETSGTGAPAKVFVEQRIAIKGQPPVPYRLEYDAVNINPRATYQVSARIENGGKTLFSTETPPYVITRGSPGEADLILTKAATPRQ